MRTTSTCPTDASFCAMRLRGGRLAATPRTVNADSYRIKAAGTYNASDHVRNGIEAKKINFGGIVIEQPRGQCARLGHYLSPTPPRTRPGMHPTHGRRQLHGGASGRRHFESDAGPQRGSLTVALTRLGAIDLYDALKESAAGDAGRCLVGGGAAGAGSYRPAARRAAGWHVQDRDQLNLYVDCRPPPTERWTGSAAQ